MDELFSILFLSNVNVVKKSEFAFQFRLILEKDRKIFYAGNVETDKNIIEHVSM